MGNTGESIKHLRKITSVKREKHGQGRFNHEVTMPSALVIVSAFVFERGGIQKKRKESVVSNTRGEFKF